VESAASWAPKVCGYLNDRELFYVVVGPWAIRAHNVREDVPDSVVDILLNATAEDWRKLQRHFLYEGFQLVAQDHHMQRYRAADGMQFAFVRSRNDYDLLTIGRRKVSWKSYTTILIASVEDLILRCLLRKDRGQIDIAAALYRGWRDHIDLGYLVLFARQLGVYRTFVRIKRKEDRPYGRP